MLLGIIKKKPFYSTCNEKGSAESRSYCNSYRKKLAIIKYLKTKSAGESIRSTSLCWKIGRVGGCREFANLISKHSILNDTLQRTWIRRFFQKVTINILGQMRYKRMHPIGTIILLSFFHFSAKTIQFSEKKSYFYEKVNHLRGYGTIRGAYFVKLYYSNSLFNFWQI